MGKNVQHIQVKTTGAEKSKKAIKGVNGGLKSMAKSAALAAGAYLGARGLLTVIQSSVEAFGKQEEAEKKLETVLKSTKNAVGMTADELKSLASRLQETTKFGDETILGAQSLMLTFTKIGSEVMPDAIETVLNMSEAMGTDLKEQTIQLGKALNDPIAGIGALSRVGVQLTDSQKALIKSFMEVGDTASAQKVILGELETQFGGLAKAASGTMAGSLAQMNNALGDAQETIGEVLSPVVVSLAKFFKSAAESAQEFLRGFTETPLERTIADMKEMGLDTKDLELTLNKLAQSDAMAQIDERFSDQTMAQKILNHEINSRAYYLQQEADLMQSITDLTGDKMTIEEKHNQLIADGASQEEINAASRLKNALAENEIKLEQTNKEIEHAEEQLLLQANLNKLKQEEIELNIQKNETSSEGDEETLSSFEEYALHQQRLLEQNQLQRDLEKERIANQKKFIELHYEDAVALGMVSKEQQLLNKYMAEGYSKKEAKLIIEARKQEVKEIKKIEEELIKKHNLTKDFNIKEAHADAYGMAAEAYKAMAGIPIVGPALGVAAAAVAYAAGMSYKAGILKAQYGADFVTDGPQMMMVGEGSGPERVQVTPLSDPNIDGPQGQGITLNISGNVLHESFIEDNVIPQIREGLRLGENIGL